MAAKLLQHSSLVDRAETQGDEPDGFAEIHLKERHEQRAIQQLEEVNKQFALVTVGTEKIDTVVAQFTEGHERFVGYRDFPAFRRAFTNHRKVVEHANPEKWTTIANRWLTEPAIERTGWSARTR